MKKSRVLKRKSIPVGYARRLQKGHDKGRCGEAEIESTLDEVKREAMRLAQLLRDAPVVVVHTGAGLSTAAGIPDFRGQRGVWTLEEQGHPLPEYERCWDNAMPTLGHMALVGLMKRGLVHAIISQNVDGLHLRSGIPRDKLCELHGNLFMEVCSGCEREYRRTADVGGVGFQQTGRRCSRCGAPLLDVLLDWEDELRDYEEAVDLSDRCSVKGGLALCLGTSLQISPSKDLPAKADKMAIVNLQKTSKDKRAAVVVRAKIDTVMRYVMRELDIPIPVFTRVETLVVSHTACRQKGGRCRWTLAIGDASDGARCGYVDSMTVTFPGTKLAEARLTRATKLRVPLETGNTARSGSIRADHGSASGGDDRGYELGKPDRSGTSDGGGGVGSGSGGDGACGRGVVGAEILMALLELTFVAAPGQAVPKPQTVEYRMNLSKDKASQDTEVFLGEVQYAAIGDVMAKR